MAERCPPPRRFTGCEGAWVSCDDLPGWWVVAWPDGTLAARHRRGRASDVTITPGDADQPMKLLIAFCGIEERLRFYADTNLHPFR